MVESRSDVTAVSGDGIRYFSASPWHGQPKKMGVQSAEIHTENVTQSAPLKCRLPVFHGQVGIFETSMKLLTARGYSPLYRWAIEAANTLSHIENQTSEDVEKPSSRAWKNASILIRELGKDIRSVNHAVFPDEEGGIALQISIRGGCGALFVFEAGGSGVVFFTRDGENWRERYNDALELSGSSVQTQLRQL